MKVRHLFKHYKYEFANWGWKRMNLTTLKIIKMHRRNITQITCFKRNPCNFTHVMHICMQKGCIDIYPIRIDLNIGWVGFWIQ